MVRACALIGRSRVERLTTLAVSYWYTRSNLYYRRKPKAVEMLNTRLHEVAERRPRWGWPRLLILLRREQMAVGEYRFRRIYRGLGLQVRPRKN